MPVPEPMPVPASVPAPVSVPVPAVSTSPAGGEATEELHTGRPAVLDEDAGLVTARLRTLLSLGNPAAHDLWRVGQVTAGDVATYLASVASGGIGAEGSCPDHEHVMRDPDPLARPACRPCEVGRVSWFYSRPHLLLGWDDPHPVCFDAGFGWFVPEWPFSDGNHRLAAAALRGDLDEDTLFVVSIDGDWQRGVALLVDEADTLSVGYDWPRTAPLSAVRAIG